MKDINNVEIKIGDNVKTKQPAGGILSPAPPQIGEVILAPDRFGDLYKGKLFIKYKKRIATGVIDSYISLEGKINEII